MLVYIAETEPNMIGSVRFCVALVGSVRFTWLGVFFSILGRTKLNRTAIGLNMVDSVRFGWFSDSVRFLIQYA